MRNITRISWCRYRKFVTVDLLADFADFADCISTLNFVDVLLPADFAEKADYISDPNIVDVELL